MQSIDLLYNPEEIREISLVLNQIFTKDRLVDIFKYEIRPFIINHNARIMYGGKLANLHTLFQRHKTINASTISKDVLMQYAALMLSQTNLLTWFYLLPDKEQTMWLMLLHNAYIKADTAAKLTGKKLSRHTHFRYYDNPLKELPWLGLIAVFDNPIISYLTSDYVHIPYPLLKHFNQILVAELERQGERPKYEPKPDMVVNAETLSQSTWPIIYEYLQQGIITASKTKLLTISAVKTISTHAMNAMPTPEGAYHDEHLFARLLGTIVTCDYEGLLGWSDQGGTSPHESLKRIFPYLHRPKMHLIPIFTSHISGLTAADRQECKFDEIVSNLNTVIKVHDNEWLTCEQLIDEYRIINGKQSTITGFMPHERWSNTPIVTKRDKHIVCADEMVEYIGIPMLKGLLMLYGALGILELAYEPVKEKDSISPFDCVKAVRLTTLGRYVIGKTHQYSPPKVETKKAFEASKTKLIVQVLDENTPYLSILSTMATSIGNNRWLATAKDMLTGCESKEALQNKIDTFKHYVDPDPSPVWQAFFNTMLNHCKPLKKEPLNNKYYLYSIDPNNQELVELFTTDPVIRSLIIRAENMLILVPIENYAKLVKRCREFGYLI